MHSLIETILIIGTVTLTGFGLLLVFKGMLGILYGTESKKWPVIKGVITKSEVISGENEQTESHAAIIHYNYWVKQKSYVGKRVGFSSLGSRFNASSDEGDANYISNQYPKGDAVDVFYHPKFHSLSVLEPGFSKWSILVLTMGLLFSVLPTTLLLTK